MNARGWVFLVGALTALLPIIYAADLSFLAAAVSGAGIGITALAVGLGEGR